MNFGLTPEQRQFADQVRGFAREHLAAGALKRAHDPGFPFDVAQLMAKHGLMGITLPASEGGHSDSAAPGSPCKSFPKVPPISRPPVKICST
jgi:alkylation response protein AidB-like acyl-CoA dehydrogenase